MRVLKAFGALVAVALVAAACSSGGSDDTAQSEERSRSAPTTDEQPTDGAAEATEDGSAEEDLTGGEVELHEGASEPADPAAAEAEIREVFEQFFDSEIPQDERFALAQDFEEISDAMAAAEAAAPPTGHRIAEITDVSFTGETTAEVTLDIVEDGNPLLEGFIANAVLEDGVWKVARSTGCQLAQFGGSPCPEE